jgi:pimeloyl-ACP methyl ester carboxylesterase
MRTKMLGALALAVLVSSACRVDEQGSGAPPAASVAEHPPAARVEPAASAPSGSQKTASSVSSTSPKTESPRTESPKTADAPPASSRLKLVRSEDAELGPVSRGTFTVFEDRRAGSGRTIDLAVVVLHARREPRLPDPVFYLAGGPGQDATTVAATWANEEIRERRDLVLVSQRGTGGSQRLACELGGTREGDTQSALGPMFVAAEFQACLAELSQRADLRLYSTPIAMDDLDDVRRALGYEKIDLVAGSYGTRAALVYMRQHGDAVRCAILEGVAPIAFTNPLYHAREAQRALDAVFAECAGDPECSRRFPALEARFASILAQLAEASVPVEVEDPDNGERVTVRLSRDAFAEALRVMLYYLPTNREVPLLIDRAAEGDFAPFARAGIAANRGLRRNLSYGMLLCVTCAEDVARIDEASIVRETADTFLGDRRVRDQQAACAFWPRSALPADYAEPVTADVPTLVISGTEDPVTSPFWGAEAASHLPRALHLVIPGAHGIDDPCVASVRRAFLDRPEIETLDTSCVAGVRLPPFDLAR